MNIGKAIRIIPVQPGERNEEDRGKVSGFWKDATQNHIGHIAKHINICGVSSLRDNDSGRKDDEDLQCSIARIHVALGN